MEIGFWRCLWREQQEGRLLLRMRIPEVCVFHGPDLEGWYCTSANGLVVRRRHNTSLQAMLECFCSAQDDRGINTPVAIMRTYAPVFEPLGADAACTKVPQATVLTAEELIEVVNCLQCGELPEGMSRHGVGEWSIQSLVDPAEDVRVLSVYSCDAMAVEKGDIFGRRFHKVYNLDRRVEAPTTESVIADRCLAVAPSRRAVLEAKTLSLVRYVSRFHNMDFEGLILEFVFDCQGRAVLHGCWGATVFGSEPRQRITELPNAKVSSWRWKPTPQPSVRRAARNIYHPAGTPRVFPVPSVEQEDDEAFNVNDEQGEDAVTIGPIGLSSLEAELKAKLDSDNLQRPVTAAAPSAEKPAEKRPSSARARLESSIAAGSVHGVDADRPPRTQSERDFARMPHGGGRVAPPSSTETRAAFGLQITVRSPHEHVCGAELAAHWGMDDADGHMSTHLLAAQVAQRLSSGRLNRSALLMHLSGQIRQFHELQLAWAEQRDRSHSDVEKAHKAIEHRNVEIDRVRRDSEAIVKEQQRRLAEVCREMCAVVDEHRVRHTDDENALAQSQHRLAEQKAMVQDLVDQGQDLRVSLEKTVWKFDEATAAYNEVQEALNKKQAASGDRVAPPVADLGKTLQQELQTAAAEGDVERLVAACAAAEKAGLSGGGDKKNGSQSPGASGNSAKRSTSGIDATNIVAQTLNANLRQEEGELTGLKTHLRKLQDDLVAERGHASRLEDFVRRIAKGPSASVRTGGGFVLDSSAKREAVAILQEVSGAM
mmetsp:Transcript_26506/g.49966  ORF Transcript_26506/g.49966 Transcript_26506/m.49966 type:complete len:768 (+) Transcript_26506:67-2370(+)